MQKEKIIFIGTPEFAVPILEKLINNNYKPVLVITVPDKPTGRKQIITSSPIKITAQKYGISISQPEKIYDLKDELIKISPELIIVAGYSQFLPKEILEIPKYGCLNVHPSLLPKYRGASPIQYAILNGEKKTGTTIMLMDEKMDHGKIIAQRKFEIGENKITFEKLSKDLSSISSDLLIEILPEWIHGRIKALPQTESMSTLTKIIKKEDGRINWEEPAEKIERKIRAFNPWPGTFTLLDLKILKILKAEVLQKKEKPGKVFQNEKNLTVGCGENSLILEEVQIEGKKPMTGTDFLRGHQSILSQNLN